MQDLKEFYELHGCPGVQKLYVEDVTGAEALCVSRLVHQTEHFVASVPFAQVPRGRLIVAPKRHSARFEDSTEEELKDLGRLLRLLLASLYRFKASESSFKWHRNGGCGGRSGHLKGLESGELRGRPVLQPLLGECTHVARLRR